MHRRVEVSSSGIDESLQGISSSPFASAFQTSVGLRIPTTALTSSNLANNRYLFCLATRTISKPTTIVGIRQLLTIGASLPRDGGEGPPATSPVTMQVVTPDFKFLDGNVSWHLVRESAVSSRGNVPPPSTDAPSFRFRESPSSALLYETFTAAAGTTNPITGAPIFYPTALTTYTPPSIWFAWQAIAEDLFSFNDLRYPWDRKSSWNVAIPIDVGGEAQRISLYASVLQTAATAVTIPNYPATLPQSAVLSPEWQFILTNFNLIPSAPTIYWRVGGALVFEDAE